MNLKKNAEVRMALSPDPSYIDLVSVIRKSGQSWDAIRILLDTHPLNPVKSFMSHYSILNRDLLGKALADLDEIMIVYEIDKDNARFLVHHGILRNMLDLLGLSEFYDELHILTIQANKFGKYRDHTAMQMLKRADAVLYEFSEYFMMDNIQIDKHLFYQSYQDYRDMRHKECQPATPSDCDTHGLTLQEFSYDMSCSILQCVMDVLHTELEICGEVPLWKTVV